MNIWRGILLTLFLCIMTHYAYAGCSSVVYFDDGGEPDNYTVIAVDEDATGEDTGGSPDMKIERAKLSKSENGERHRRYTADPGENVYSFFRLDNDGGTAYDFKLKFYIDGGKKSFDRDDEDYIDSIRIDTYYHDAEIWYGLNFDAPTTPGKYYVYACVTSLDDDTDEDNNCSGEGDEEEYGILTVVDPDGTSESLSWDDYTDGEKAAIIMQSILN